MGKFDNMLLVSDYDNTLCYTEAALRAGTEPPPVNPKNLEAIRYWMEEGGTFAMATGRALPAFRAPAAGIPMNAPAIVNNGAGICDLREEKYLVTRFLPDECLEQLSAVAEAFPDVSMELYHAGDLIQVLHPTAWNEQHAKLTEQNYQQVERLDRQSVPLPLTKALFVADKEVLDRICLFMEQRGWTAQYEPVFSSDHLLELTATGADKGHMALKLKELCGCTRLYCIGDHANDLSMLLCADRGFAPANAIPEVLASGVTVVCHCLEGAVAEAVKRIEEDMEA